VKIRHRITLWAAGAGLLISIVFSLVIFLEMREQPFEVLDSELGTAAETLLGYMARHPGQPAALQSKELSVFGNRYWIKVFDRDMHLVYRSDLAAATDIPLYEKYKDGYTIHAQIPKDRFYLHQDSRDEVAFRVRVIRTSRGGGPSVIQIARPMESMEEEISGLLIALATGLACSAVLLIIGSYVFAGRIVKPIAEINRLSKAINENTLETRIPLGKSRDELHELSSGLNRMFDRLQYSFARQKRFLASASHELRTPIAMLRLFFEEAVQQKGLTESFRQQLVNQERIVLRMERLVKTLLELSVLELQDSLEMEEFSLTDLVRSVLEEFTPVMVSENIRCEVHLAENLVIRGDQDKIRRVLINILDNAVKYSFEHGKIEMELEDKGDSVRLSLSNTGSGVPKNEQEQVFEEFYRVEKSRSSRYGGSGLGLAIVRQIVRRHGGEVVMESAPGAWARIDITLPNRKGGS
jgi:two-component system OmpR family sensor kinase